MYYNYLYKLIILFNLMVFSKKKSKMENKKIEKKVHQVGLDLDAYGILSGVKNQLINKYKNTKSISFSDTIRELRDRSKK